MKLFELTTGRVGCSYERAYVWCKDAFEAEQMFKARFKKKLDTIRFLFNSESPAFITDLDDDGWSSIRSIKINQLRNPG
ncbi:unnamed protein product [marine sediment metagenome]|uniref:Uncharacterized protein n=1 Tax=marine sediment metagenome TaxID=412755 RepID=X1HL60_9ZZZZ